jgi:hypothetical protein
MIELKYNLLFEIEFIHGFYQSGKCTDLALVPTEQCSAVLKQSGLKFLSTPSGAQVYAQVKTQANEDFMVKVIPNLTRFSFLIKQKNHSFENFTRLNLNKPKANRYYFNNLNLNLSSESAPLLVSNTTDKIVSDGDHLPFVSNYFSYAHSAIVTQQRGELHFPDSGETFIQELESNNNIFNFSFDLNKTTSGKAVFLIDNVEAARFYAISSGDSVGTWGLVDIFYKADLDQAYQFQNPDGTIQSKNYQIPFENRATKWRYIVSKKFNLGVTGIKVSKANGNPIAFTEQPAIHSNQFIFSSNSVVPLKEDVLTGIKLSDQDDKILIANLPNPPLTLIRTEGSDVYSDILITI